ncbi:MAG: hypothetical protein LQ350_005520 [Teloschistes chrysophthalmus]|nr:MAG: hypothetical protein LQ350_005520 [Niorma chrysophthalma]
MGRTYSDAVTALNTLQKNSAVIESVRKAGMSLNSQAIPEMIEWCRRVGYEPVDFDKFKPIHIAGTKGKGSTSAFVSSILTQFLPSSAQPNALFRKIGLYTSPHLRFVRERIRINNEPLSERLFARYFFEVWDKLEESARTKGEPTDRTAKPSYFRFLTLMAFHTYIREGVNTAVIECGIGGEYDSTNIIVHPSVTGITSLGIDHVQLLGKTIEEIAWHKAGIMKEGAPAFTVPQLPAAQAVLEDRAKERSVELRTVQDNPFVAGIELGLEAPFQRSNASLAVKLAMSYLQSHHGAEIGSNPLEKFVRGLERVRWPGRCETRREDGIAWHIDSGHTLESIKLAASWFAGHVLRSLQPDSASTNEAASKRYTRVLMFNQQTRDAPALARALHSTITSALKDQQPFTHVVFCTNLTFKEEGYRPDLVSINADREKVEALKVQKGLRDAWKELDGGSGEVEVKGSIQEAVEWVRGLKTEQGEGEEILVLVTGSSHLVGGFLEVLESGKGG